VVGRAVVRPTAALKIGHFFFESTSSFVAYLIAVNYRDKIGRKSISTAAPGVQRWKSCEIDVLGVGPLTVLWCGHGKKCARVGVFATPHFVIVSSTLTWPREDVKQHVCWLINPVLWCSMKSHDGSQDVHSEACIAYSGEICTERPTQRSPSTRRGNSFVPGTCPTIHRGP
jgi:hypothetical protein